MTPQLELRNVSVAYDGVAVVSGVSLSLARGAIGCLLGPSGGGKTSLLRAVAGFEPLAVGEIALAGTVVSRPGRTQPPEARNVGMVFQDFALFPHLSVRDNIGFGLRKWEAAERERRVAELLALIGLPDAASAYPHHLSGGMQQRVALARAMAPRPAILLLDEPFSSIDADLREHLAEEVRAMLLQSGMTAILVTHDQAEAFATADCIAVLGEGRLRQWDTAYRIYHEPADRFVANFIGMGAMLSGKLLEPGHVRTELGDMAGRTPPNAQPGDCVCVLIRPDDIIHDDDAPLQLEVVKKVFRGASYLYSLRIPGGTEIYALVPSHHDHAVGGTIGVRLALDHVAIFPGPE